MAFKPLMMMRTRGVSGPFMRKHANHTRTLSKSVGSFIALSSILDKIADYAFVGAWKAETDVQDVQVEGNVMNLMPKGTASATSTHPAPIYAQDHAGVWQEYAIDAPVWKGVNYNGGAPLYDDLPDVLLCCDGSSTADGLTPVHLDYTYPAANINPSDVKFRLDIDWEGDDVVVMDIGGVSLLSISEGSTGDGHEIIENGGFDDDSVWLLGAGFSISSGVLNSISAAYNAITRQAISVTEGEFYLVKFDYNVLSGTDTENRHQVGFGDAGGTPIIYQEFNFSGSGTEEYILEVNQPIFNFSIRSRGAATSDMNFNNVSVQKVLKVIVLSDGTNSLSHAAFAGRHKLDITLTTDTMRLEVDGSGHDGPYIPIAAGLITVSEDHIVFASNPA